MNPDLTVILQAGGERQRATECLRSLLGQQIVERMEILLLDYGLDAHPPLSGSDHPSVRLLPRSAYEPLGQSRALAVREARAPVLGFIEDHVTAFPGWAEGILAAHAQGWKAIGGEVHCANPGVGISDAIGMMNYWRWLPSARMGVHDLIVGHNAAYDRELLLALGEEMETYLRCDPVLQWYLQEQGIDLFLDPAIKISHINETEISSILRGYFQWNRVFAPTRAEIFRWSLRKRLLWILLAPLIPPVRIYKQLFHILGRRPDLFPRFLASLYVQWFAHSAAAAGQVIGLVFGMGSAETDFLYYELNQARRVTKDRSNRP